MEFQKIHNTRGPFKSLTCFFTGFHVMTSAVCIVKFFCAASGGIVNCKFPTWKWSQVSSSCDIWW